MMDTFEPRPGSRCKCVIVPSVDPREWVGGQVDELTVAFGSLMLREPELVESLLVLDALFVDG